MPSHPVMKPQESGPEVSQDVVGAHKSVLGWKDVDTFAQRSDITGPDDARVAVNGEVKAWVSKAVSGGGDDKGAVGAALCSHDDDRIAVRQRENNLHTRVGMAGERADGIETRVKNIAAAAQPTKPGGVTW